MSTPFRLLLPRSIGRQMIAHAQAQLPNECVGMLAGRLRDQGPDARSQEPVWEVVQCYRIVNALASPTEYDTEPASLGHANRDRRLAGLEILAFYHSHPTSEAVPSRKDIARNTWGICVMHFIISLKGEEPMIQGWWLNEDSHAPADWEWIEDEA